MMLYPKNVFLILRRFAAFSYDSFLLFSLLFISSAILVAINDGESVSPDYLMPISILILFLFYGWFWTHGGQTLGMRAWRIKITNRKGVSPNWRECILRVLAMYIPMGIGSIWILFNQNGQSFQDLFSSTITHKV